jgi:hypothetical protein
VCVGDKPKLDRLSLETSVSWCHCFPVGYSRVDNGNMFACLEDSVFKDSVEVISDGVGHTIYLDWSDLIDFD